MQVTILALFITQAFAVVYLHHAIEEPAWRLTREQRAFERARAKSPEPPKSPPMVSPMLRSTLKLLQEEGVQKMKKNALAKEKDEKKGMDKFDEDHFEYEDEKVYQHNLEESSEVDPRDETVIRPVGLGIEVESASGGEGSETSQWVRLEVPKGFSSLKEKPLRKWRYRPVACCMKVHWSVAPFAEPQNA